MKLKEKLMFSTLGLLIFFFSGGLACTYSNTGAINPALAVILGVTAFFTAGGVACTYGNNKIAKQKTTAQA